ncbi:MAG: DUF445 domain-containing protein [Casimicrobiaceae bacterium]
MQTFSNPAASAVSGASADDLAEQRVKESLQERRLASMRRIATGLLLAMGVVFAIAHLYEPAYPTLAFVRAFAEAAMVGALADWFAVTALFRHPLGIPIPHTAILPRGKDRLGENLGKFVEQNFLAPEVVAAKIADSDYVGAFAKWLVRPEQAASIAGGLTALTPRLLHALDDADVRRFIKHQVLTYANQIEVAPLTAEFLTTLTAHNRHQELVTAMMTHLAALFDDNKSHLRQKVEQEVWWVLRKLAIDEKIYRKIVAAVEEYLTDVRESPRHALRLHFDKSLAEFIDRLKTSADYREKAEALKRQLLESPALHASLENLWDEIKVRIASDIALPDSRIKAGLQTAVESLSASLQSDTALRGKLNHWLRELIVETIRIHGHNAASYIADVVRRWDAETVTRKIELEVGRDLQYIRINGTLIGGLVGLVIYSLTLLF